MIKNYIRSFIGLIVCKRFNITYKTIPFVGLRMKVANQMGGKITCGSNVSFSSDTYLFNVTPFANISFGNNIRIAHHFQISCAKNIIIKSNVNIAPFVFITDHNHAYEDVSQPIMNQGILFNDDARILIEEGCWIGTKVTIVGNIRIGRHCVIGANSVVTKDIPDYSIAAGIPCKVIKHYDFTKREWVKG